MVCINSVFCPQGVFSLKNSYFEPRYILLIPTSTEEYVSRMKARGLYSNSQMDTAVSRIDLYVKINRERPGFFDSVISSGRSLDHIICTLLLPLLNTYRGAHKGIFMFYWRNKSSGRLCCVSFSQQFLTILPAIRQIDFFLT